MTRGRCLIRTTRKPALLALADGSVFRGTGIGAEGTSTGEVVFNTALTGYQEILTDPSYAEQIVTLTYPHIGNVGCNPEDEESGKVWCRGLVIRDLPLLASNFRSTEDLSSYLKRHHIVGLADIDTRRSATYERRWAELSSGPPWRRQRFRSLCHRYQAAATHFGYSLLDLDHADPFPVGSTSAS